MPKRARLSAGLSGVAGEYFVAAELSRRGYVASITLRNTRGIDILASNADATRSVGIQVKCTQGGFDSWLVGTLRHDDLASNLFFVFVSMNDMAAPAYYVVPKRDVADYAASRSRQAQGMQKFADREGKYRDRWDLLNLDEPVA